MYAIPRTLNVGTIRNTVFAVSIDAIIALLQENRPYRTLGTYDT